MTLADSDAHRLDHLEAVARLGAGLLGDRPDEPLPESVRTGMRRQLSPGTLREIEDALASIGDDTAARDVLGAYALLLGALPDDPSHALMAWLAFLTWRLRDASARELTDALGRIVPVLYVAPADS
jgi:hypothetical protein